VSTVHSTSLQQWLDDWDIRGGAATDVALELFHAAPGCVRSASAFSQSERWESLDTDAAEGCIRDLAHAH
jgi:dihydroxy-acid dehydratase